MVVIVIEVKVWNNKLTFKIKSSILIRIKIRKLSEKKLWYIFISICRFQEWFELKRTLKMMWLQPPCHSRCSFHQIVLPKVPSNEHLQGWDIHGFSGQPDPMPHHPDCEESIYPRDRRRRRTSCCQCFTDCILKEVLVTWGLPFKDWYLYFVRSICVCKQVKK